MLTEDQNTINEVIDLMNGSKLTTIYPGRVVYSIYFDIFFGDLTKKSHKAKNLFISIF